MYVFLSSLFLLGLIIGSFISVLTYRIPRNLDFVKGRSFCDSCKKKLRWFDNIPLFSFLYYKGKSRCCNKKISARYPLIEITSGLGAVVLFYLFPFSLFTIHYSLFTVSLAILVIDLENQIIPDELSWLILLLGLITLNSSFLFLNLFSGFLFSLILLFIYLSTLGRGMGLGDVKLAIPLGLWLGLEKGLIWITTSFILGGIVATVLLLLDKAKMKTKIAFGPFLIVAFWIVLICW